jgi:predicted XRE-type DNA-binding protein
MTRITESSGDVFRDLGFTPTEALNLRLRSELMLQIRRVIEERKLTQVQAASLFEVAQPRISDIVRGKIHRFTIDFLVTMLSKAGVATRVATERRHPKQAIRFVELLDVEQRCVEAWSHFAGLVTSKVYQGDPVQQIISSNDPDDAAAALDEVIADTQYALCA